jgi:MFS family permease
MNSAPAKSRFSWLNRTVLGIGLASLFSDWSHEMATAVMPAFLATMGVAAFWVGLIEGVSDGLSSFAKMASGYYTDKLQRRKPVAVIGYLVTAVGTASFGLATAAWHVLLARAFAWLGRGVRTPVRKALLAGSVTKETYGRAFGFERMMDTLGAIVGPATAFFLLGRFSSSLPIAVCGDAHPKSYCRGADYVCREARRSASPCRIRFVWRADADAAAVISQIPCGRWIVRRGRLSPTRC